MNLTSKYSICIAIPTGKDSASRARRQFNTLVRKTEAARARLAGWKEAMPSIMAEAEREFQPLVRIHDAHQRNKVLLLDQMHREKLKGKRERAKLSRLICSIACDLLADDDDPELRAIYDRHCGEAGSLDGEAAFMDLMSAMFDTDAGDVGDEGSPEDLFAAFGAQPDDDDSAAPDARDGRASRRKSASALARERRQEADAAQLKQTVREIFRKLTSELHPDREPDAAERTRKTALMQRVTVAYKANDLLGLLGLQLEIEQIGQADLNGLSVERTRQYNKILDGQLREVEAEIAAFEHAALVQCAGRLYERPTPRSLLRRLRVDIAEMRASVKAAEAELQAFRDVNTLKAWLKTYRPEPESPYDDAYWF